MRSKVCLLLLAAGILTWAGPPPCGAQDNDAQRPNIVLIMADDIGYECFGCYGSRQYRTPHIDRLADAGMRFAHCYSQPLCTPSRVQLMTGLSNVRNYSAFSILNPNQTTIGQRFQQAGYRTMAAGKWQLLGAEQYDERFRQRGTWPQNAGFDHFCLWQVDRMGSRYWAPQLNIDGQNQTLGQDQYGPQRATEYILDFMRSNRDGPFFVYYPMILVHNPFQPTPDSASRQSTDRKRNFEDMVAFMDKLIGQIVDEIQQLGIAERTLILFTADNGTNRTRSSQLNGRLIQGGKGQTLDAGTHVPLIACWPGRIQAGSDCADLVDFTDFLPTLLQAAGQNVPEGLDGRSFYPQLVGQAGDPRQWIYSYYCPRPETTSPVRFARDKRWKLYGDGVLFDIQNDPLEEQPITAQDDCAEAAAARRKLSQALDSMPAEGQSLMKFQGQRTASPEK